LVGNYLRALMRVYKLLTAILDIPSSSKDHVVEHDIKHRLDLGPFPVEPDSNVHKDCMISYLAKMLGVTGCEVERVSQLLDKAQSEDDLKEIKLYVKGTPSPDFKFYLV
jgi:hypothetical protein